MTPPPVRIELAHAGLWTFDFERMVRFYTGLFGFWVSDQGRQGTRRYAFLTASAAAHHQLVIVSGRVSTAPPAPGGLNQVSFRLPALSDLRAFHARLATAQVSQVTPLTHGNAWSIYFHDPELNRIEVFVDTPWHMPQPFARELDLTLADEEILRFTEELCRQNPESRPYNDWRRWAEAALGGAITGEHAGGDRAK
ncbi:MAG TPA: VOC family protein [Steroidobacteraceae bacterium]|nr:VOC family protein [Steroidobacteraceae bacterium]